MWHHVVVDSGCIVLCDCVSLYLTQLNMTPLMCAAHEGHSSIVELLLSKGADPNLRNIVSHLISGWCCVECCSFNAGWRYCI